MSHCGPDPGCGSLVGMIHARRLTTAAATLALLGSAAVAPAFGKGDDDVRKTGSCTSSSETKLKLSPEDGGLEIEFEVDENRAGRTWDVTLRSGSTRLLKRAATTRGPSGSFEVRKVVGRTSGTFRATATSRTTGEVCRVRASI